MRDICCAYARGERRREAQSKGGSNEGKNQLGGNQRAFIFVAVKNALCCVSLASGEGVESVVLRWELLARVQVF